MGINFNDTIQLSRISWKGWYRNRPPSFNGSDACLIHWNTRSLNFILDSLRSCVLFGNCRHCYLPDSLKQLSFHHCCKIGGGSGGEMFVARSSRTCFSLGHHELQQSLTLNPLKGEPYSCAPKLFPQPATIVAFPQSHLFC